MGKSSINSEVFIGEIHPAAIRIAHGDPHVTQEYVTTHQRQMAMELLQKDGRNQGDLELVGLLGYIYICLEYM